MKNERFLDFALIQRLFKSPSVRRRMADNYLGIILTAFVSDLHARGYTREGVRHHVLVVEHFGRWLQRRQVRLRRLSTLHVLKFLRSHLPRCRCPRPAPKVQPDCRASLRRFVEFLRRQRWIKEPAEKTAPQGPVDRLMAAYDGYLARVCGLSVETRRRRQHLARQFLRWQFGCKQPQRWQSSRKGATNRILILSRYLGHSHVEDTYWYLTALPQLLADAAQRFVLDEREDR